MFLRRNSAPISPGFGPKSDQKTDIHQNNHPLCPSIPRFRHEIYPLVAPVQPRSVFTALSVGNVAVVSYLEYLSQDMKVGPNIHDILSRLWPVFRERHHDRIRYMSLRLKLRLNLTSGESNRLNIWPSPTVLDRFPWCGGRFSSIEDVCRHAKLKGS